MSYPQLGFFPQRVALFCLLLCRVFTAKPMASNIIERMCSVFCPAWRLRQFFFVVPLFRCCFETPFFQGLFFRLSTFCSAFCCSVDFPLFLFACPSPPFVMWSPYACQILISVAPSTSTYPPVVFLALPQTLGRFGPLVNFFGPSLCTRARWFFFPYSFDSFLPGELSAASLLCLGSDD